MAESLKKITGWKAWVLGIAAILAAVISAVVALVDDDPETKPDIQGTIEKVTDGVKTITGTNGETIEVPETE